MIQIKARGYNIIFCDMIINKRDFFVTCEVLGISLPLLFYTSHTRRNYHVSIFLKIMAMKNMAVAKMAKKCMKMAKKPSMIMRKVAMKKVSSFDYWY